MSNKQDANQRNIIFLICSLILCISLIAYDIYNWTSETGKCVLNPYTYGVAKLSEANGKDLVCRCYFNVVNSQEIIITKQNITVYNPDELLQ